MYDDHIDDTRTLAATAPAGLNRRILVGSAVSAGLATAGYLRLVNAQTETGTPEAEVGEDASATPGASASANDDDTALATGVLDNVQAMVAAVQGDRDAVADEIDVTTVDEVLSQASSLLDDAQSAIDGGDAEGGMQSAAGAWQSARAARDLIIAQLTYAGLPSQEASASRVLARAHELIDAVADEDAGPGFYLTTAQQVYEEAYNQYADGAYAQALANGRAIVGLVGAASILSGAGERWLLGMPGVDRFGRGGRDRVLELPTGEEQLLDDSEPEPVPAPDF